MKASIIWLLAAISVAVVIGAWLWREKRRRKSNEDEPASIVILLERPRPLNVQVLAPLLSQASGRSVRAISPDEPSDPNNAPAGDVVAGESPHFIAHVAGTIFVIHNLSTPYVQDPTATSESIPEPRLRKAMKEHKAWISMDVLHTKEATTAAYRVVAQVMSNFVGPECLALYHPPLKRLVPCSDETVGRLKNDDPIKAVFQELDLVPVVPVEADPRLRAAEEEAKRRFPEFETAFNAKDGSTFSIKARISTPTNTEHIWVEVDTISSESIDGRLGNEPVDLGSLKLGSRVEVRRDQVWCFLRNGKPVGMFTVPVIRQVRPQKSGDR